MLTIEQLKNLKESEHRVEFKRGEGGNVAYNGGTRPIPKRRRCILGYVTALCNEGGGYLVVGMGASQITVASTPRNRLLADVLAKTGVVERSGQGIDKIVTTTLSEGKPEPDYSQSDDFNVELHISGVMEDRGFALFIESVQQDLPSEDRLSVLEIVTLANLRYAKPKFKPDKKIIAKLLRRGLVERKGKTSGCYYILCRSYYDFAGDMAEYARKSDWDEKQMLKVMVPYLSKYESAKMAELAKLLEGHMVRRQIRTCVGHLVKRSILISTGTGSGTRYSLNEKYRVVNDVLDRVLDKLVDDIDGKESV